MPGLSSPQLKILAVLWRALGSTKGQKCKFTSMHCLKYLPNDFLARLAGDPVPEHLGVVIAEATMVSFDPGTAVDSYCILVPHNQYWHTVIK